VPRTIIPISIRRLAAVGAVILAVTALLASQTAADHGLGHNGETMTLSKDSDISDGETSRSTCPASCRAPPSPW